MDRWYEPGGCRDRLLECQKQAKEDDPNWQGDVPSVIKCFKEFDGLCKTIEEWSKLSQEKDVRFDSSSAAIIYPANEYSLGGSISLIPSQIQHPNLVRLIFLRT
jgi:hypothetical protein